MTEIICLILTIIILILVLYMVYKQSRYMESFENCFKMQYYGIPFYQNSKNPICSNTNTTDPLYREGGCSVYDPSEVQKKYYEGKYQSAI